MISGDSALIFFKFTAMLRAIRDIVEDDLINPPVGMYKLQDDAIASPVNWKFQER